MKSVAIKSCLNYGAISSQSELRLPLLQVVSSNKYFSVGVQSPTEINAPRGCAVILKRRCQLALTRITHQVSRAFDLNMLEYTSCSYDMISTDIYGTVSNTASRPGIIDHSISGIDCNVADTAFTISSIEKPDLHAGENWYQQIFPVCYLQPD